MASTFQSTNVSIIVDKVTPFLESSVMYLYEASFYPYNDAVIIQLLDEDSRVNLFDFAQTLGLPSSIEDTDSIIQFVKNELDNGEEKAKILESFFKRNSVEIHTGLNDVNGLLFILLDTFNDGFKLTEIISYGSAYGESESLGGHVTLDTPFVSQGTNTYLIKDVFLEAEKEISNDRPLAAGKTIGRFVDEVFLHGIKDHVTRQRVTESLVEYLTPELDNDDE